jgi:predicted RNA-binding protein with PIN domain
MLFLIDGYNLLYDEGLLLRGRTGPLVLERARLRLLDLLHQKLGPKAADVTVVFDAKHAPPGAAAAQTYQGIRVLFAPADGEADDLIEDLIRRAAAPEKLTVVSNDHRIHQAAKRRKCAVQRCGDYLTWLDTQAKPPRPTAQPRPEREGGDAADWLREFGDLDADLREVNEPFDFGQEGENV